MTIGFGMRDPVLNNRRNKWHQKRYHVRIPKRAESKKYLDAYYTEGTPTVPPEPAVPIPGGFNYMLTVGTDGVNQYGVNKTTPFGNISPPATAIGALLTRFTANSFNNVLDLRFGAAQNEQPGGATAMICALQGYPSLGAETNWGLNWQVGNLRYTNTLAGQTSFIAGKNGQSIPLRIYSASLKPGFNCMLFLGKNAELTQVGFTYTDTPKFGFMTPAQLFSASFNQLKLDTTNGNISLRFSPAQPSGKTSMVLQFDGFARTVTANWDAANTRYLATDSEMAHWLNSFPSQTYIPVNIT